MLSNPGTWIVVLALALGLHGTTAEAQTVLADPSGDVFFFDGPLPPGSPEAPDLLEVTAGYTSDDLVVSVTFAEGTMQAGVVGIINVLALDLDLDSATGGSFAPGADKLLFFATDLTFATICDEITPPLGCGVQVPVATQGDSLEVVIPLDATGLDDDGVALFGFVTGLFMGGQPVTEDEAFDGVSSSRERRLTLSSSAVAAPALPVLGLATRIGLVAALVVAAEARRRRRSAAPGAADRP